MKLIQIIRHLLLLIYQTTNVLCLVLIFNRTALAGPRPYNYKNKTKHTQTNKQTYYNYFKTRQTRSSKTGLVWQGLQCMGCSKLLAEGGYDIPGKVEGELRTEGSFNGGTDTL